jgi:hypothetical protein
VNSSSASDTVITGNTISNTDVALVSGGGAAIRVVGGLNVGGIDAAATFNVSNNTMRDSLGTALAVNKTGRQRPLERHHREQCRRRHGGSPDRVLLKALVSSFWRISLQNS